MTVAGVSQTALARFYGLKGPQREPVRLQEAGGLTAISGDDFTSGGLHLNLPQVGSVLLNGLLNGMELRLARSVNVSVVREYGDVKRWGFASPGDVTAAENDHQLQPTDVEDARRFKWRGIRESRTWDHWAVGAAGHDQENKCEKDAHTIIPNHYATNQPFVYWTQNIRKVNRLTHVDYIYWQSESTLK